MNFMYYQMYPEWREFCEELPNKRIVCKTCGKDFKDWDAFIYHYRYSHYEEPEYMKKANEDTAKYMERWNRIMFGGGSSEQKA